jgi:hypothetical protein
MLLEVRDPKGNRRAYELAQSPRKGRESRLDLVATSVLLSYSLRSQERTQ